MAEQDVDGRTVMRSVGKDGKLVLTPSGGIAAATYSGGTLTATFEIARDVGWDYFEKLAKQRVMQVQSASDPSKKLAIGERAVSIDGGEYNLILLKEAGEPIDIIYPTEGSPLIIGPGCTFKDPPNPNAAKLLTSFMFSQECQQFNVDIGGLRSVHNQVKDKAGRKPLSEIKTMKDDPAGVEKTADAIKAKYVSYFKA
jgi:iron(III) transport system substrate-binding protein